MRMWLISQFLRPKPPLYLLENQRLSLQGASYSKKRFYSPELISNLIYSTKYDRNLFFINIFGEIIINVSRNGKIGIYEKAVTIFRSPQIFSLISKNYQIISRVDYNAAERVEVKSPSRSEKEQKRILALPINATL